MLIGYQQELQQARQELTLAEIRKSLNEVKTDANRRLVGYQKEVAQAERDVTNAEKKLMKSKEQLEKHIEFRSRIENMIEDFGASPRSVRPSPLAGRETRGQSDRTKESEDMISRYEREISEDIRSLFRAIQARDKKLVAGRKAFQTLTRDCKQSVATSLKKLITHEKELNISRNAILDKLEETVNKMNVEEDITDFILTSRNPENSLILCSQAIQAVADLNPAFEKSRSASPTEDHRATEYSERTSLASVSGEGSVRNSTGGPSESSAASSTLSAQIMNVWGSASSLFHPNAPTSPKKADDASSGSDSSSAMTTPIAAHRQSSSRKQTTGVTSHSAIDLMSSQLYPAAVVTVDVELYLNCIFHTKKVIHLDESVVGSDARKAHALLSYNLNYDFEAAESQSSSKNMRTMTLIPVEEAIKKLALIVESSEGRNIFTTELNKFRSKKVDVGEGFLALGAVIWAVLLQCHAANDFHSAKVLMMLIQTFYRQRNKSASTITDSGSKELFDDDGDNADEMTRETGRREYLKEILVSHPIWQDPNFWEQVLLQCASEQVRLTRVDGITSFTFSTNSCRRLIIRCLGLTCLERCGLRWSYRFTMSFSVRFGSISADDDWLIVM